MDENRGRKSMTEENKTGEKEPKFVLDKDSVDFLQSQLNATINPELKDDSDYYRAVFYFKCCGLKKSAKSDSLSEDDQKLSAYYQTKDKIDALFENIYEQALKFQDAINTGDIPYMDDMEKMNQFMSAGMAAQTITTNEMLSEK